MRVSQETVAHFGYLLQEAQAGRLVGAVSGVMHAGPGGHFSCYFGGECERNPTFTRGMVAGLADVMSKKMLGGK